MTRFQWFKKDGTKIRWDNLLKLWNKTIEEQILKSALSNNKKKGSKEVVKKFSSISVAARDSILSQHIIECKKYYLNLVKDYYRSRERLLGTAISKFSQSKKNNARRVSGDYPIFSIIPSTENILKMVESALKISI